MNLLRSLPFLLLAGCLPHQALDPRPVEEVALKVTAEPPSGSIPREKRFTVNVRVENISQMRQSISEWNCSREKNWQTETPGSKCPYSTVGETSSRPSRSSRVRAARSGSNWRPDPTSPRKRSAWGLRRLKASRSTGASRW